MCSSRPSRKDAAARQAAAVPGPPPAPRVAAAAAPAAPAPPPTQAAPAVVQAGKEAQSIYARQQGTRGNIQNKGGAAGLDVIADNNLGRAKLLGRTVARGAALINR